MPSSKINNVWGSNKLDMELECPSGQVCLVRKSSPEQLVAMGIIDRIDVLSKLVDIKHVKRVKGKPSSIPSQVDVEALSKNPKIAVDILTLADKVVEAVVLEPNVKRPTKTVDGIEVSLLHSERIDGQVYTDMIDFMDRMFIFQHAVGGNTDLHSFREQFQSNVANMADVNEV
jgi:hypothetical protein